MIFVNVRSKISEPQIDLFYNEAVTDGNGLAIAIKFCPDIHPSKFTSYHAIVVDAFKDLFANKSIEELYGMFFGRLMIKGRCVWDIRKIFSKWASEKEFTETITVVLFITYRFYSK